MSNHSASHHEVTPAPRGAGALHEAAKFDAGSGFLEESTALTPSGGAGALHMERLHFYREAGVEYIVRDNQRLVRDTDLARLIGFSRTRNIRKLTARMIEDGGLAESEFLVIDEEAGGKTHYVSQVAAVKLAMRSEAPNKEQVLVSMLAAFARGDALGEQIPVDKALAAFERTLGRISREKDATIRAAYIPVLERYARMAGVPVPARADLLGAALPSAGGLDQPRLPGV